MTRTLGRWVALTIVGLAAVVTAFPASASPPEAASGTFVAPPPAPDRIREAGGNCFVWLDDTFVLAGTLDGTLDIDFRLVFHGPCFAADGQFHGSGTFSGAVTVAGATRTGAFDFVFDGSIDGEPRARGKLVVRHGSGGLAGLHGVLELEGVPGQGGVYSGAVRLDPRR